jgi:hypothetical protein
VVVPVAVSVAVPVAVSVAVPVAVPGGGAIMSINRTRGVLYTLARVLGDVQAVRKGRVGRRIGRRVVGRVAGRGMGRLFR